MSANGAVVPPLERLEALAGSYGRQSCLYPGCSAMLPLQFYNLHLNYCRRKWRGPLITCPFNSTHRYGQPEDVFHRHVCPDKAFAEAKSIVDDHQNVLEKLQMKNENVVLNHNRLIRRCKLVTIVSSADLFATVSPHYENGDTMIVSCGNEHMQREQTTEKLVNVRDCPMNTFRIRSAE